VRPTRTLLTAFLLALAPTPAATREPVAIAGMDTPARDAGSPTRHAGTPTRDPGSPTVSVYAFLAVFLQVVHRARNQVQASGRGRSRCLADLE
jgi:hypothetical protein